MDECGSSIRGPWDCRATRPLTCYLFCGKDGKAFNRTFRYMDTWVERNGQWQCVAEQVALISGTPAKE